MVIPENFLFDQDYLEKISYDRVMEIYQERFTDASDFIFYIVGDVSKEVLRPLVEKYLGSIRDLDRQESWVRMLIIILQVSMNTQ